jgi:eukaryotic-like serine/threonine-protein kinase
LKNLDEIYFAARELPSADRPDFLAQACAGDDELQKRVKQMLAVSAEAEAFITDLPDDDSEDRTSDNGSAKSLKLDLADAPDEAVGQTLGRYKLLERVGEGGCGVVYVAEQTEPVRRRVALKVIKLGMDTKQVVARFEAERQALAMMDHPNIAKVLDAGTTDVGRLYFVMELVRGIRITDHCDQANLTTRDRLDLFIKVCQAIQHAHQKGIIHRDIKPSNILVTLHDGVPVPKVIDFGIAKATEGRLTDATVYTQLHQFIGTPAYMSPEQAEMSGLDIDTRSDIYSLGVLLYELLAGSTPFDAKELMASGIDAMRKTIRETEPMRPSTRLATLQGEELTTTAQRRSADAPKLIHLLQGDLDWIVMKCLEKDRTRRYETANGLAADIQRHLKNEPVVARPPTVAYRFQKSFRRNKLVFTAATAVAIALLVGIAVSTWQTFAARRAQRETEAARTGEQRQRLEAQKKQAEAEAERQRAETEQQRADAQARKATESQQQARRLLYASDMNLAQQSLNQNNLGKARRLLDRHRPQPGEEDLRGWEWRYLWQLTRSSALVTLTNRPLRGSDLSFSPDGSRLAVGWEDGRVDLWDVPGRRLLRSLTEGADFSEAHVAFSPARNLLVTTSSNNVVKLLNLDSGLNSILWQSASPSKWKVHNLWFSPDGLRVVIYAERDSNEKLADVWVVNVSSFQIESHHTTLFNGHVFFGTALLSPDRLRIYLARSDESAKRYSIQCLNLGTGQVIWQTDALGDDGLSDLAISPDGRVLVSGSGYSDSAIRIWDSTSGRLLRQLEGHTSWVCKLVFSKDGRQLVSSAADQTIRFWDTSTWTETKVLRGHSDEVSGVARSETAQLVASTGKDGNLMLWKVDERGATDGYRRLPETLSRFELLPLDHSRVLLLPKGKPPELVDLRRDAIPTPLAEIAESANVLGWFGTNLLCYWNGTNQIVIRELRETELTQRGAVTLDSGVRPDGVACDAARQVLAWSEQSFSKSIFLASFATPGRRVELKGDVTGLVPKLFSDDGRYMVAWTPARNSLRAWNVETGQIVASIEKPIRDAILAAGGRVLVVLIETRLAHEIAFYDLAQLGNAPRRFSGKYEAPTLAVSPDGRLVAYTSASGLVRLFDPAKGEWIESLHGHLNAVFGIAFSPDGRRLSSTSVGGREAVKLWDIGTRQELLTLAGTGSVLLAARWSADGDVILVGRPWQAWRAPSWEEIAAAEAKKKAESNRP